jgi:regulator of sigma E protease
LVLGVLVLVHEFGHYITARLFKVTVNEFSIGMGPKLIQRRGKKYDTLYTVRALPVGGYVSMPGEDGESDDENAFCHKKWWQRLIILSAGAAMNIVLGFLLMLIIVCSSKQLASNTIAMFNEGAQSPSYGLCVGDTVTKVNGVAVHTGDELVYEITNSGYEPIDFTVKRRDENGKTVTVRIENVQFSTTTEEGITFGDYDFKVYPEEKTVLSVIKHTFFRSVSCIKMVFDSLSGLISGRFGMEAMSGPVGITESVGTAVKFGGTTLIYLVALITMNLGVFNLLPVPALDGGRILFVLIEAARGGRRISPKVEGMIHYIGIMILFGLMILVTFKDIINLF